MVATHNSESIEVNIKKYHDRHFLPIQQSTVCSFISTKRAIHVHKVEQSEQYTVVKLGGLTFSYHHLLTPKSKGLEGRH